MKTVSEVAKVTGLSRRAIRFYDESGLLHPTKYSDSGYRLYDDKALETLQQILFFKELDVPLKDIKQILNNPNLDRKELLKSHKEVLTLKRDHLNNLIELIDRTIENPEVISFKEFDIVAIEKTIDLNLQNLKNDPFFQEGYDQVISQYGSHENFKDSIIKGIEENQDLIINLYGSLENYNKSLQGLPQKAKNWQSFDSKLNEFKLKLSKMIDEDLSSNKVQGIVAKMDKLMIEFDGIGFKGQEELKKWALKKSSNNPKEIKEYNEIIIAMEKDQDEKYGKGFIKFFDSAVEYYLKNLK